jgi:hypothetical protein
LAGQRWLLAAGALREDMRWLSTGLHAIGHPASALRVARGIRGVMVAVSLASSGNGVPFASRGLPVFGLIFLGGERCETGVVLLTLHAGERGLWA